jgi:hypothetical protein
MALKAEELLPGVTFYLENAAQEPSTKHKAKGRVILTADIDDFNLWDETIKKFDGLRIYDSDSFQHEMLEMLQEDGEKLSAEVSRVREEYRTGRERLLAELAYAQQNISALALTNARQSQRIRELEAVEAELNALSSS